MVVTSLYFIVLVSAANKRDSLYANASRLLFPEYYSTSEQDIPLLDRAQGMELLNEAQQLGSIEATLLRGIIEKASEDVLDPKQCQTPSIADKYIQDAADANNLLALYILAMDQQYYINATNNISITSKPCNMGALEKLKAICAHLPQQEQLKVDLPPVSLHHTFEDLNYNPTAVGEDAGK